MRDFIEAGYLAGLEMENSDENYDPRRLRHTEPGRRLCLCSGPGGPAHLPAGSRRLMARKRSPITAMILLSTSSERGQFSGRCWITTHVVSKWLQRPLQPRAANPSRPQNKGRSTPGLFAVVRPWSHVGAKLGANKPVMQIYLLSQTKRRGSRRSRSTAKGCVRCPVMNAPTRSYRRRTMDKMSVACSTSRSPALLVRIRRHVRRRTLIPRDRCPVLC
jgi:hypothetical protein